MPRPTAPLALAAALAALAALAPVAGAASPADPTVCDQSFGQVFSPWNDRDYYALAPGGDFEADGGWALSGDAALVTDGVGNRSTGSDVRSLRLGQGGVAETRPVCVTQAHRTMRFFTRDLADRSGNSALRIEMVYTNANGGTQVELVDNITPSTTWAPTTVLRLDTSKYYTDLTNASTTVRFRLSAGRGSSVQIDDAFVDPRLR